MLQSQRLRWYFARLAAMNSLEIPHRVIEKAKKAVWKRNELGWSNFDAIADGPLFKIDCLALKAVRSNQFETEKITEHASDIRAGALEFLGTAWPRSDPERWEAGNPPAEFWLADPLSGEEWPGAECYCFSVDYRNLRGRRGDVKYLWELNRLQFLHPIVAEAVRTGDHSWIEWAMRLLESWAHANPPYRGINWTSGIELALRLVTIALVVSAAKQDALQPKERKFIRQLIAAHGYWLNRYPSRYSSANNHVIAEGLGLLLAGTLAPDLPGAADWVKRARSIFEIELLKQIYPDGVGGEQSPSYEAFVIEMVSTAILVFDSVGSPLPRGVLDRLARGAEFLSCLLDRKGRTPSIGDDDEGRVFAQGISYEPRYVASIVAAVAGLVQRPDLMPSEWDPQLRDAVFHTSRRRSPYANGMRVFPIGGYSIIRDTIQGRCTHLAFDHGPLGYLSLAAHGHADALSVWLTIDDQPVFVDAGTFLYHSGGMMRDRFRGTLAHNTINLAGRCQSQISGPFIWSSKANARLISSSPLPQWSVTGEHDGYVSHFGVRHVRRIARQVWGISIDDHLDGIAPTVQVNIQFLCHPFLTVSKAGDHVEIWREREVLLRLKPPTGFDVHIFSGEKDSPLGWYSPRFGFRAPAPHIRLSGVMVIPDATTDLMIVAPASGSS